MTSRTTLLKRAAATVTAAGVALAGTVVLAATPSQAATKKYETPFAYQGSAYGTRVSAGDPNQGGVASGRTAWSVLGCTAMAPIRNDRGSNVGKVNANDYLQVGAVTSYTSSYRRPKKQVFGSRSVNKVADITLGPEGGPRLKFAALTTTAHAYNDKGRFRAAADINLVGVDAIDEADNQAVEAIIEGAGTNGIDIPGLGKIYPAGSHTTPTSAKGATANAYGIRVILENGSQVNIGRAWARIQTAYPAGVFAGHAYGYEAVVGEGVAGLGRTPYQNLPCIGTDGEWRANPLAEAPQNAQLNASALKAETFGKPFRDGRAIARARASVAEISLGGGALEIQGIVGQVNVFQNKAGRVIRRTLDGTRVAAIIADGEPQEIPAPGESLEIPGVAFIKAGVRQNLGKRGVRVHALRIELLDGTGLVLNVGTAKAKILR